MIPVSDVNVYRESLRLLLQYKRANPKYKGRFVQIFLALKFYQNGIPSMFSGAFISTDVLQTMLDDLYAKGSKPLNACVLSLFQNSYLAMTGINGQNTWRNNFNLQKGIGCYATVQDLSSPIFLAQNRVNCMYLRPAAQQLALNGASCSLCTTGATYRNESHRKWLRIDSGGAGYAVVDILNVNNFAPYVAPSGNRVPIIPLISALYHDATRGLVTSMRQNVDINDFLCDFNFSPQEAVSYFDDDPGNIYNASLLSRFPAITYSRINVNAPLHVGFPGQRSAAQRRGRGSTVVHRQPQLSGTPVQPPNINSGWDAQQFVISALRSNGWTVFDVSRQQLGYDLLVQRGRHTRYVEVKSSLGLCTPSLTAREWQQAQVHGRNYILAIIENFNPNIQNTIYWIADPNLTCSTNQYTSINFNIPRTSWSLASIAIANI